MIFVYYVISCRIEEFDFEIFSTSYANRCSLMGFQLQNLQCEFSTQGQPRFRTKTLEKQDCAYLYAKCISVRVSLAFLYLGSSHFEDFSFQIFLKIDKVVFDLDLP